MDPRGSPPWFGTITVKSNFGQNRWPRGSLIMEFEGMVIFYGFDPFFGPNGTPLAKKWTLGGLHRDFTVKSNFGRNRWPRGSRIIEFLGHGNFLRFWPIHWTQWDPIGHKVDPRWSTPWFCAITVKSNFGRNRWPRGSRKFEFGGMVIFYGGDQFLDPIGHKVYPRWSAPWFCGITVKSNFGQNRWPRGSRKVEFGGMVIFYGGDPIFGPNGIPLAPRWTLGSPHCDLAP